MNAFETSTKITSEHIKRNAYLYIRQSTIRQVIENTESTKLGLLETLRIGINY